LTVVTRRASRPEDLDAAFAAAAGDRDQAMVVQFVALTFEKRWRITALAGHFRLPEVYPLREYVEAVGLISYGPAIRDNFERADVLVGLAYLRRPTVIGAARMRVSSNRQMETQRFV
jgi:putative ABC transport system substrate-binding protein